MDAFNDIGFLSSQLGTWGRQTRTEFRMHFELAAKINRLGMKILFDLRTDPMNDAQSVASLCFGRALQSYQCALILMERGAASDARALIRSCTESVIILSASRKDASIREKLEEDQNHHRLRFVNAHLERDKQSGFLDSAERMEFRDIRDKIKAMYGVKGPSSITLSALAEASGTIDHFNLIFRITSNDGAHATARALSRHIGNDTTGGDIDFNFQPDRSDIASTLMFAYTAMLQALGSLVDWFNLPLHQGELDACIEGYDLLLDSHS